jgi:hypothetical protein
MSNLILFDGAAKEVGMIPVESQQAPPVSKVFHVKVAGIWKQCIPWVKVGGVWKQAIPYVKVGGVWN